jgi:hypothetical protein
LLPRPLALSLIPLKIAKNMDEESKSQDPHDADPGIAPSSIYKIISPFLIVCGSSAWQFPSVDVPSIEINNQIWTLPFLFGSVYHVSFNE